MKPMKRLLMLLTFLSFAYAASAQYIDDALIVKKGRIYQGGVLLTEQQALTCFSDLNGVDKSEDYLKYTHAYKVGKGMQTGGAIAASLSVVTGGICFMTIFHVRDDVKFKLGQGGMMASGLILWGGVITSACGTAKKRRANRSLSELTINIQSTDNGLGLALAF